MKLEIVQNEKNTLEFYLLNERHTIANLLKEKIVKNNDVEFNMSEGVIESIKRTINLYGNKNIKVYFLDDSLYSGKTRNKINDKLKEVFDIEITHTYVVYDGSLNKEDNVTSMFRYHNLM